MNKKHIPLWVFTLSAFIGLFICRNIFDKSNFVLHSFSDRTIGIAVLEGIDIASRSVFYLELFAIFSAVFLVSAWLLSALWKFAKYKIGRVDLKTDSSVLFTLSAFSIFILIFHYINGAEIFVDILNIFKFLMALSVAILIFKIFAKAQETILFRLLNNYNLVILSFFVPLIVFFIRWMVISNGSFIFTKIFFAFYLVIWGLYWILLRVYFQFVPKTKFETKLVSVLSASVPLMFIPLSAPILNEVQYALSGLSIWSIRRFEVFGVIVLVVVAILIFFFNKSKNLDFKFAKNLYLPLFVATATLFTMHINFLNINYVDMFHHGENLISTQQLFLFSRIPFINLYPTHGISYMLGQALYSLINGYQPFAPWLWEWIAKVLEVTLFYFVLTKLTNSFFSAITIVFLPIIGIFGGQALIYGYSRTLPTTYYFAPFLVGLVMIWALRESNFKSLFVLWLSCLLLTVWRVDFGIASFAAAGLVSISTLIKTNIRLSELYVKLKTAVLSLVLTLLLALLLFYLASIIGHVSIINTISEILEFVKFQGQAQGLPQIIPSYSPITVFQYLVLPGVGAFYIIYFLYKKLFQKDYVFKNHQLLLVFLAIFSTVISIRSLQRQTLAVIGYNPFMFAFLLISIPVYINRAKTKSSLLFFTAGLLIYQFVLPNNALILRAGQQVTLYDWHNKESRVNINDQQFKEIVSFLNSNLSKDQTFLDMSSSPLLYVASNREFINYLIPSAYYTSDVIQREELNKISAAYNLDKIPILIFRQPVNDANNIDGVPNEIRSYKIYEFIYSHYRPVGKIMGFYIWTANGFDLINSKGIIPDTTVDQQFNLLDLPYIWANYDTKDAKDKTKVLQTVADNPLVLNPNNPTQIILDKNLDKSSGNYIGFRIQSNNSGTLTISYGKVPVSQISFDLIQSPLPKNYLARISSQYYWMTDEINRITLASSVPVTISKILISKGD